MQLFVQLFLLFAYLFQAPCSCNEKEKTVLEIVENSPTIFVGKLLSKTKIEKTLDIPGLGIVGFEELTFEISEYIKADIFEEKTIVIVNELSACGEVLDIGKTYLVFPYRANIFNNYRIHTCYKKSMLASDPSYPEMVKNLKEGLLKVNK